MVLCVRHFVFFAYSVPERLVLAEANGKVEPTLSYALLSVSKHMTIKPVVLM